MCLLTCAAALLTHAAFSQGHDMLSMHFSCRIGPQVSNSMPPAEQVLVACVLEPSLKPSAVPAMNAACCEWAYRGSLPAQYHGIHQHRVSLQLQHVLNIAGRSSWQWQPVTCCSCLVCLLLGQVGAWRDQGSGCPAARISRGGQGNR